jgi:DNA-binding LacI/PurR family transcriptional regulator
LQDARSDGFRATLRAEGVDPATVAQMQVRDSIDSGYTACLELLARHPRLTAIFATNDLLAIGAMQALVSMGRAVPDDVSVIGITDIQLAHQVRPALTSVAIQTEAVAELSIRSLIALIDEPNRQPPMVIGPPPELVPRMSTGPRRRRVRG